MSWCISSETYYIFQVFDSCCVKIRFLTHSSLASEGLIWGLWYSWALHSLSLTFCGRSFSSRGLASEVSSWPWLERRATGCTNRFPLLSSGPVCISLFLWKNIIGDRNCEILTSSNEIVKSYNCMSLSDLLNTYDPLMNTTFGLTGKRHWSP